MDASSKDNPSHLTVLRADETSLSMSPPTSFPTASSVSVLNNANNTCVKNSTFSTTNNNYTTYNGSPTVTGLELLYKFTAPNAILNSGGRADEGRCHPGTRKEVIGLVEKSIAQKHNGPRMLWLSGPAGAGKSAIMQTVAERCEERGVPHANFFFFRADTSRRDSSGFVATLIHQIIQHYPSVGPAVATALASNPLLFEMGLQKQFDALMGQTLATVRDSPSALVPLTLLIDGLDECDSESKAGQRQLLQALDALLVQKGTCFRVVIASRVEPQISMAFRRLRSKVDSIFLDEQYFPERDIRLFVTAEFDQIKMTHYLAHTLGPDWPSESDINSILSKSSGQFIFAATVMRFIAHSSASPILNLQKVQMIVPSVKNTPFIQLDAVYTYILEQVDDLDAVKTMFALQLLGMTYKKGIGHVMEAYRPSFSEAVFDSCLSEFTSLTQNRGGYLQFFHASFPDFLRDQSRARVYHIDLDAFCTGAVPIWWAYRKQDYIGEVFTAILMALVEVTKVTPKMTAALMEPHPIVQGTTASSLSPHNIDKQVQDLTSNLHRIYATHNLLSLINIMACWLSTNPKLERFFPQDLVQSAKGVQQTSVRNRAWSLLKRG